MRFGETKKPIMTDQQLMTLVRKGDQGALAKLYDRYSVVLVNFFFRMLNKDLEKAQDFMHDLFVKIIETPSSYDNERPFDTWLFSIAYNQCKNEYRKISVRDEYKKSIDRNIDEQTERIRETYDVQAFEISLNEVLASMDEKHKSVFLLRYQQGLSLKEIAEIAGCPEGTVKSRLFSATRELADSLKIFDPRKN